MLLQPLFLCLSRCMQIPFYYYVHNIIWFVGKIVWYITKKRVEKREKLYEIPKPSRFITCIYHPIFPKCERNSEKKQQ